MMFIRSNLLVIISLFLLLNFLYGCNSSDSPSTNGSQPTSENRPPQSSEVQTETVAHLEKPKSQDDNSNDTEDEKDPPPAGLIYTMKDVAGTKVDIRIYDSSGNELKPLSPISNVDSSGHAVSKNWVLYKKEKSLFIVGRNGTILKTYTPKDGIEKYSASDFGFALCRKTNPKSSSSLYHLETLDIQGATQAIIPLGTENCSSAKIKISQLGLAYQHQDVLHLYDLAGKEIQGFPKDEINQFEISDHWIGYTDNKDRKFFVIDKDGKSFPNLPHIEGVYIFQLGKHNIAYASTSAIPQWHILHESGSTRYQALSDEIILSDERIAIAHPMPQGESELELLDSQGNRLKGFTPFKVKNHSGYIFPRLLGTYLAYSSQVNGKAHLNILNSVGKPLPGFQPFILDFSFIGISR